MNGVRKGRHKWILAIPVLLFGILVFPYFGWIIGAGPVPGTPGMFWKNVCKQWKSTILYVKSSFRKKQKTFIQRL